MDIGKMRHRITFQRLPETKDELAAYGKDWYDVCTVWADIRPLSGREFLTQVRENTVSHKIYCRYRAGINPRMRIRFGKRIFRIQAVLNQEERNVWLTILCEELVV